MICCDAQNTPLGLIDYCFLWSLSQCGMCDAFGAAEISRALRCLDCLVPVGNIILGKSDAHGMDLLARNCWILLILSLNYMP